jgi:serine/threonine-protein kinase
VAKILDVVGGSTPAGDEEVTAVASPDRSDPASWSEAGRGSVGPVAGTTVSDRYFVLEEAGRGGMGRVLRAYDPKLQREVALKVVRSRGLDAEAQARLVVEARAMAKLSHPNVVAIFDVEDQADNGVVVLVMEYVAGSDLKTWLRRGDHPWQDVLARFLDAGHGLAAAHQAGILHRDFKPANVLVDDTNRAKVTDFGLAKRQGDTSISGGDYEDSRESGSDLTAAGVVMGTPRYMSPEQHMAGGVTERSDQYAFCIALWEGLVGTAPFSGEHLAEDKLEGPPPWPKAGIPRRITDAIRRGISADPRARWPDMDTLLEALAYDPARIRNRWLLGLTAAGVLGLGAAAWQSWSAQQAQRCSGASEQIGASWNEDRRAALESAFRESGLAYADTTGAKIQTVLDGYAAQWAEVHTEACEATTVRGEQSAAVMDLRMACLHRAALDMEAIIAVLADAGADPQIVKKADSVLAGLSPLSRCSDVEALQEDADPPRPEDSEAVDSIRSRITEMYAHSAAGRFDEAQGAQADALELLGTVDYEPVRTEVMLAQAELLDKQGKYDDAEAKYRETLELGAMWGQRGAQQRAAQMLLHVVGDRLGRPDEGLRYLELARGLAKGQPRRQAGLYLTVSNVLRAQGKIAESEEAIRKAIELELSDPDDARVARARSSLAGVLYEQAKYAEAEAEMRIALEEIERALGPKHPDVGGMRSNLGLLLQRQEKYDEAEAELRLAVKQREDTLGRDHPLLLLTRGNLVDTLREQGKFEEAEAEARAVLELRRKRYGPDHPELGVSYQSLGNLLKEQGRYQEAEAEFRNSVTLREKVLESDHPYLASSYASLGGILYLQKRYDEAETYYRKSLAMRERSLDPQHEHLADSRFDLAITLYEQGRFAEAKPYAELAWERRNRDDVLPRKRAKAAFLLAEILWQSSSAAADRKRALSIAHEARETWAGVEGDDEERAELDAWLAARER